MIITFLTIDSFATDSLVTYQYDSVANTFSAVLDTFATASNFPSDQRTFPLVRRSDGTMVAVFNLHIAGTHYALKYLIISAAGLITSSGNVDLGSGNEHLSPAGAVVDSSDIVHIWYTLQDAADSLLYTTLSALNVAGARHTVTALPGVPNYEFGAPILWTGGDSLLLPRVGLDPATFYVGTPVSAPVWTTVQAHALDPAAQDGAVALADAGNVVKVFYIRKDGSTILEAMVAQWDGAAMGVPAVYWDIGSNPPVGMIGKTIAQMGTPLSIAAFQSSTTTLGVAVSMRTSLGPTVVGTAFVPTTPPGLFAGVPVTLPNAPVIYNVPFVGGPWGPLYLGAATVFLPGADATGGPSVLARSLDSGANWTTLGGPAPAGGHSYFTQAGIGDAAPAVPLVVECNDPPIGIVATFYTHDFSAATGTPPYTFSITGGALPAGLTLDAATGTVSGTPTLNGTFPFTIQATDSLDVSGQVNCTITIRKRCMLVEVN